MESPGFSSSEIGAVLSRAFNEPWTVRASRRVTRSGFEPTMDIRESRSEFVIFMDLPGIDEDELQFTWTLNSLKLAGSKEFDHDTEDAEEFIELNRVFGPFSCHVEFGSPIDGNRASAKYKRGVLKLRIPKATKESK